MHEDVKFRDDDPAVQIENMRKDMIQLRADYELRIWSIHFRWIAFTFFLLGLGVLLFLSQYTQW